MQVSEFFVALRRFWYAALIGALVGAMCSFVYNQFTYLDQADAYVAVVSPKQAALTSGVTQAQVSFGSIVESYSLATIVAKDVGEDPDTVYQNISVQPDVSLTSGASTAGDIPLLIVSARDHGIDRATWLVNTVVDEGRKLYIQVNGVDGAQVKSGLLDQQDQVQQNLSTAQAALAKFESDNNAVDLPNRLNAQQSKVDSLSLQVAQANAAQIGDYYGPNVSTSSSTTTSTQSTNNTTNSTGKSGTGTDSTGSSSSSGSDTLTTTTNTTQNNDVNAYARDYNRYQTLKGELGTEQAELGRLQSLLGQYNQLQFQVDSAQKSVEDFNTQAQTLLIGQIIPAQDQIKILDPGRPHGQLLFLLLIYGLGAIAGLMLGIGTVYVLALVHKKPPTLEIVADTMAAPVLVRIPKAGR